jgi:hypothetical protein
MRMSVRDRLPGVTARIKDNAVTRVSDTLGHGYLVRPLRDLCQQAVARGRQAHQVRIVSLRYYQNMNRRLRIDIAKCQRALGFEHASSRNLTARDLAEEAIGHGPDTNV